MYVMKRAKSPKGVWQVGFYETVISVPFPESELVYTRHVFVVTCEHKRATEAAIMVNYLNGGATKFPDVALTWIGR